MSLNYQKNNRKNNRTGETYKNNRRTTVEFTTVPSCSERQVEGLDIPCKVAARVAARLATRGAVSGKSSMQNREEDDTSERRLDMPHTRNTSMSHTPQRANTPCTAFDDTMCIGCPATNFDRRALLLLGV